MGVQVESQALAGADRSPLRATRGCRARAAAAERLRRAHKSFPTLAHAAWGRTTRSFWRGGGSGGWRGRRWWCRGRRATRRWTRPCQGCSHSCARSTLRSSATTSQPPSSSSSSAARRHAPPALARRRAVRLTPRWPLADIARAGTGHPARVEGTAAERRGWGDRDAAPVAAAAAGDAASLAPAAAAGGRGVAGDADLSPERNHHTSLHSARCPGGTRPHSNASALLLTLCPATCARAPAGARGARARVAAAR